MRRGAGAGHVRADRASGIGAGLAVRHVVQSAHEARHARADRRARCASDTGTSAVTSTDADLARVRSFPRPRRPGAARVIDAPVVVRGCRRPRGRPWRRSTPAHRRGDVHVGVVLLSSLRRPVRGRGGERVQDEDARVARFKAICAVGRSLASEARGRCPSSDDRPRSRPRRRARRCDEAWEPSCLHATRSPGQPVLLSTSSSELPVTPLGASNLPRMVSCGAREGVAASPI